MLQRLIILLVVITFTFTPTGGNPTDNPEVDVALVLAIDTSGSVNADRYQLQMSGYAEAFRSQQVAAAIQRGIRQSIAVAVVHWCDLMSQRVVVPWTRLSDKASLLRLARVLDAVPRVYNCTSTSVTGGIAFATQLLDAAPFRSLKKIIDVSGDGKNSESPSAGYARDEAVSRGFVINGLAITAQEKDVVDYYRQQVIGGLGSFVIEVSSYGQFAQAVRRKLVLEIAGLR